MSRYEIRGAVTDDEEALLALARELNTVNLPNDRPHIQRLLLDNQKSFAGEVPQNRRKYVFILWDRDTGRAAGTSMIIAQLGRRGAPYIYFDVTKEEKYAASVDKHFHHQLLRIGFSYDGPTEIGGLIVAPDYRKVPERLGLLVSYIRFLFIATRRKLFRDELLAELLPPLEPDGTSHLWEAIGRRFTDMSYAEADLLSSENKDFIRDLFPRDPIYVTLLNPEARALIGQVGAQTKGVEKMLRRVGFKYVNRVDPFDGGPHFAAPTDEVSLVKATVSGVLGEPLPDGAPATRCLVARDLDVPPFFHAVGTRASIGDAVDPTSNVGVVIRLQPDVAKLLGLVTGDRVHCLPLP
ncbi:MAG TPA: arginine N-succinyltransferase [Polyangiaceae bacterium]|jgi:arginine N-succinyltransferase|nr:arginine N-succinyltransferase [Polyangiaceae bacterium]